MKLSMLVNEKYALSGGGIDLPLNLIKDGAS